jgi:hypothetical protein
MIMFAIHGVDSKFMYAGIGQWYWPYNISWEEEIVPGAGEELAVGYKRKDVDGECVWAASPPA